MWLKIRRHFFSKLITGTLVLVPLYFTFASLILVSQLFDKVFAPLIQSLFGFSIPGLSWILAFAVFYSTGWFILRTPVKSILDWVLEVLSKVPLISRICIPLHLWVKAVLFDPGRIVNKPVLVSYPREGMWTIGFLVSSLKISGASFFSVFIPTLPNPLTGYLVFQPANEIREPSMSYQDAVKMVFSGGIISPERVF